MEPGLRMFREYNKKVWLARVLWTGPGVDVLATNPHRQRGSGADGSAIVAVLCPWRGLALGARQGQGRVELREQQGARLWTG